MKIILLMVAISTVMWHSTYTMEMEAADTSFKVSVVKTAKNVDRPTLVVPELHEDMVHAKVFSKELPTLSKMTSKSVAVVKDNNDEFDLSLLDSPEEKLIRQGLQRLPEKSQPEDIDLAMRTAAVGEKVFDQLAHGRFYDAIAINLHPVSPKTPFEQQAEQVVATALNSDNATFWDLIKQDPVMAKSIASHNVPFTLQSLHSPEFNMYFRFTYIRKHIQDPLVLEKYQRAYQKSIVQLQWHLFAKSILQDRAFTSGMITFDDPQSRIFSFLDGYAELMSPKYKFHNAIGVHSLWADQAYARESSHWTGQKAFGGKNFGIDIKGVDGKPMSILPGNKSHILFGVRTNGMTFVKWEEYGTTFNIKTGDYSVLHHTLRYFEKKDLEDDPQLQRREKIPTVVQNQFKSLYAKPLSSAQKAVVELDGISAMLQLLDQSAPSKAAEFKKFLVNNMGYQADTLSTRKGGEIILKLSNVQPTSHVADATEINDKDL